MLPYIIVFIAGFIAGYLVKKNNPQDIKGIDDKIEELKKKK